MTVEAFIPHQIQFIQGVGPYSTDWPALDPADIAVLIFPETGAAFMLDAADFDVSVSSAGVDVTLAAQIAEDYAEAHLWIDRKTVIEQGWAALANARERGLEAQLDRITKALQEARSGVARALRFDADVVPMRPEAGRTIIFDEALQPVAGPSADQISSANDDALKAQAAALLARAWAESPNPPDPDIPDSKSAKTWAEKVKSRFLGAFFFVEQTDTLMILKINPATVNIVGETDDQLLLEVS